MPTVPVSSVHRVLIAVLLVAGAMLAGAALRAEGPALRVAPPTRVAVVNLRALQAGLLETKDSDQRIARMRDEANRKLAEIRQRVEAAEKDLQQLENKKDSPEFRRIANERRELYLMGRLRQESLQQEMDEDAGVTVRTMYLKMIAAAQFVASRDGWDIVLRDDREIVPPTHVPDKNGGDRPITGAEVRAYADPRSILVASPAVDITGAVVEVMNNDYRAAQRQ